MDRKIALKWARALESGEYKQTQGQLRKHNSFCCLGVLCNLHAQAHPELAAHETDETEYLGKYADLPWTVMEWAGIRESEGDFVNADGDGRIKIEIKLRDGTIKPIDGLVALNDDFNFNFKQIAAVIRKHSDKL